MDKEITAIFMQIIFAWLALWVTLNGPAPDFDFDSYRKNLLVLASWVILHALLSSADFFQNQLFLKNLSGIPSESNSLDPDQARHFVGLIWA